MDTSRIDRLTKRHRECLRLYHQRYRLKEIGNTLGISENTVGTYLTEATALLGVGSRRSAAGYLMTFEATHPNSRGRFSVGDSAPPVAETFISEEGEAALPTTQAWVSLMPFPAAKGATNDLGAGARLAWIAIITLLTTISVLLFIATAGALRQM